MTTPLLIITAIFILGYLCIVFEHNIHIDKAATAILTGVICWTVYILCADQIVNISQLPTSFLTEYAQEHDIAKVWVGEHQVLEMLGEVAGILFFLLGAMTIVELVDAYGGFSIITNRISATRTVSLLWIIGLVTFFLSAALDNLTTTIVMISLIRKLISEQKDRLFFAGIIVVAANAGGAWSPIGDVTTTMLWIGKQITTANIISTLFIPSLVCIAAPLLFLTFRLRGQTIAAPVATTGGDNDFEVTNKQRTIIFLVGMGGLLFVPVFKTVTHLPPFMGMLFSLGVLWVISELMHEDRDQAMDSGLHIVKILKRIDTSSILFFLGILVAVSSLQATGILPMAATWLDTNVGNINAIVFLIGLLSAVVDNVPLVAGVMGMYDMQTYPTDSPMWVFLAFAAGTGGSCLIIGSAAGVAAMGMERINFFWYAKNIGVLALLGYVAGTAALFVPGML